METIIFYMIIMPSMLFAMVLSIMIVDRAKLFFTGESLFGRKKDALTKKGKYDGFEIEVIGSDRYYIKYKGKYLCSKGYDWYMSRDRDEYTLYRRSEKEAIESIDEYLLSKEIKIIKL